MASINDFNDKFWRAIISDRPKHPDPKQIYYPKKRFSKRKAMGSAELLELRHKKGEINLWETKVQVLGNEVVLRQLEGKQTILFSYIYKEMMKQAEKELSEGSIRMYKSQFKSVLESIGDFYPPSVNKDKLNRFVNDCKYSTRKGRRSFLNRVFNFGKKHYNISHPEIELSSTKAERNDYIQKDYKSFLTEADILKLADHWVGREGGHNWKDPELKTYMMLVLFYFPRRISDIIALKPNWIQDKVVSLGGDGYVTKSQREELIAPTEEAMNLLHLVKNKFSNNESLFPISSRSFYNSFQIVIDEVFPGLSKKISPHKLRDSGIMYLLYEKGLTAQDVMSTTGHSELASLQRYMHRGGKALMEQKKDPKTVMVMLQRKKRFFETFIN